MKKVSFGVSLSIALTFMFISSVLAQSFPTLKTITIDGDMSDWDEILVNPVQVSVDGDGTSYADCNDSPDNDCPVNTSTGRDLYTFAWTYDDTNIYVYIERFGSAASPVDFLFILDLGGDGFVNNTTDKVFTVNWSGSNQNTTSNLFYYDYNLMPLDDPIEGHSLVDPDPASPYYQLIDGYDMTGEKGLQVDVTVYGDPPYPHVRSGGESSQHRFEEKLPWAHLGVAPGTPVLWHVSSSTNDKIGKTLDNIGGPQGGMGRFSFGGVEISPEYAVSVGSPDTITLKHTIWNRGNRDGVFDIVGTSSLGLSISYWIDSDTDSIPDQEIARDVNGDGDFNDGGEFLDAAYDNNAAGSDGRLDFTIAGSTPTFQSSQDFWIEVTTPSGLDGVVDQVRLRAEEDQHSDVFDQITDSLAVGALIIYPDWNKLGDGSGSSWIDFPHNVTNNSGGDDNADLTISTRPAGWAISLWSDPEGDGIPNAELDRDDDGDGAWDSGLTPNTGNLSNGQTINYVLRMDIPSSPLGTVQTVTITATSTIEPSRMDSAVDRVTIADHVTISPEYDRTAAPPTHIFGGEGTKVYFPFTITNSYGQADDFTLSTVGTNYAWTTRIWSDPDGNGSIDQGSIITGPVTVEGMGGVFHLVVEVLVPSPLPVVATPPVWERTTITATSTLVPTESGSSFGDLEVYQIQTFKDSLYEAPASHFASCETVYVRCIQLTPGAVPPQYEIDFWENDPNKTTPPPADSQGLYIDVNGKAFNSRMFDPTTDETGIWTLDLTEFDVTMANGTINIYHQNDGTIDPVTVTPNPTVYGQDLFISATLSNTNNTASFTETRMETRILTQEGTPRVLRSDGSWEDASLGGLTNEGIIGALDAGLTDSHSFTLTNIAYPLLRDNYTVEITWRKIAYDGSGTEICNAVIATYSMTTLYVDSDCLIDADCDDGIGCTDDICDTVTGTCTNNANHGNCDDTLFCTGVESCDPLDPSADSSTGCLPSTGDPCVLGLECNDICDDVADNCLSPVGTVCGDPSDSECDNPDTCDGAGSCLSNLEAAGFSCGDTSDTDCDNPDSCDGTGTCLLNLESAGFACGDPSDTECDNPDTCDGAGVCETHYEAFGLACGDPADTECDNPDSCDGAGVCQGNYEAVGLACGDAADTECDNPDSCDGAGICETNYEAVGFACGDTADTECDNPDSCDGTGICQANHEALGVVCGDSSNTACDNPDSCDGSGGCSPNYETFGFACGDPSDSECDNPDSCDGVGLCDPNNEGQGFTCGDPSDTECDNPDTCDGSGSCNVNYETAGIACGDTSDTECDNPDSCSGSGVCLDNHETAGYACGDQSDTECDNPDSCDGLGSCLANFEDSTTECANGVFCDGTEYCDGVGGCSIGSGDPCFPLMCDEDRDLCSGCLSDNDCDLCQECVSGDCLPQAEGSDTKEECLADECNTGNCDGLGACGLVDAGTACGNPSASECDRPDSCDGTGACTANHKNLGAACGDQSIECLNNDSCDGMGSCSDNGPANMGTPCGDSTDDACTNPDTCDGLGSCLKNHADFGSACGDYSDSDCDNPDSCDGNGLCLQNIEASGFACGDPTTSSCDNPDSCDGLGICLINNLPQGTSCQDGVFCNGEEFCNNSGRCLGGSNIPCDGLVCDEENQACVNCLVDEDCGDGIDCTLDSCLENECVFTSDSSICTDDGLWCNGREFCDASLGCTRTEPPCAETAEVCNEETDECEPCQSDEECNDLIECTLDSCALGACSHTPNDEACSDDGVYCNGPEICDPSLGCLSAGDPCRKSSLICNEDLAECENCTQDEDCDDNIDCTLDICELGLCQNSADDSYCIDDGNYCTGVEKCDPQQGCISTNNPCGDSVECTEDVCDETNDVCSNIVIETACDDGDICSQDTCDPEQGCSNIYIDSDEDGICDAEDKCPDDAYNVCAPCDDQDEDGICDILDPCPQDFENECTCKDEDRDSICDVVDRCPMDPNNECTCPDTDSDGVCDGMDVCPTDSTNNCIACADTRDPDDDGLPNCIDPCPDDASANCVCSDIDNDGTCDAFDTCPADPLDECNICPDADEDGQCDAQDPCPDDAQDHCTIFDGTSLKGGGCGCGTSDVGGSWLFILLAIICLPRRRKATYSL
jgi:hypothetical protein